MRARASYTIVGLFVLLLGAALIAAILWLTTGGPPRDYDFYRVYMTESVSGLSVDAPVKYKGVNRGRVREIDLDPQDPERVRLLLVVLEGTPVTADTVATLEVQGLTGVAYINLGGGSRDSPPLRAQPGERYPVIQSKPSLLVRLDDTVSELLGNLIRMTDNINSLLGEDNRETMTRTLANIERLSGSLAERSEQIGVLVSDLETVLGNARDASSGLPELVEELRATAGSFREMAATLADTGKSLGATGRSLASEIEERGAELERFTAQALPSAAALVEDLRAAADNLRRVSETLERDPSVLVFGPPEPQKGPGER